MSFSLIRRPIIFTCLSFLFVHTLSGQRVNEGNANFSNAEGLLKINHLKKPTQLVNLPIEDLDYNDQEFSFTTPWGNIEWFSEKQIIPFKTSSGKDTALLYDDKRNVKCWYNKKKQLIKSSMDSTIFQNYVYSGNQLVRINGGHGAYRDSVIFQYDDNGLMIVKSTYLSIHTKVKYIYNYDSIGRNIQIYSVAHDTVDGQIRDRVIRKDIHFSGNRLLPDSMLVTWLEPGTRQLPLRYVYGYDERGRKVKEELSDWFKDHWSAHPVKLFVYNEKGDIAEIKEGDRSKFYDYEYDLKGNWIKRKKRGDDKLIIRSIKYY